MKIKTILIISILCVSLVGCSPASGSKHQDAAASTSPPTVEPSMEAGIEEDLIPRNTTEPYVGSMDLDKDTESFFYGTWKVEKLLGFANSYNDASEYPTGQNVIGNEIVITKDSYSSKGFEHYPVYQYELKAPLYSIREIHYNKDSFYRVDKIDMPSLSMNDEVRILGVSDSSTGLAIPVSFMDVNHDRLILMLEATQFELKRVTE
ncbi:hypothetical protein [Gorillibacterium sp. CAU 1737]|uniref:hypothetical protein n=1 Tax=Gorillibacterium sp. CAU 1737 TaxID=3140362 RepID=UPI003261D201